MARLCGTVYQGPIVPSHLSVRVRNGDGAFACAVRDLVSVVRAAVDGGRSTLKGRGLSTFVYGDGPVRSLFLLNVGRTNRYCPPAEIHLCCSTICRFVSGAKIMGPRFL